MPWQTCTHSHSMYDANQLVARNTLKQPIFVCFSSALGWVLFARAPAYFPRSVYMRESYKRAGLARISPLELLPHLSLSRETGEGSGPGEPTSGCRL